MLNIFNVNGNTITGVCSQIQESVYRTLIEACQVPGVLKLSGTHPLLFFSCSIFLHLSHYQHAWNRQLPSMYHSMKKYQIRTLL